MEAEVVAAVGERGLVAVPGVDAALGAATTSRPSEPPPEATAITAITAASATAAPIAIRIRARESPAAVSPSPGT